MHELRYSGFGVRYAFISVGYLAEFIDNSGFVNMQAVICAPSAGPSS
jgi:hypothetical protein